MPRPVDSTTSYLPGLDGLRALAVALVIAFHLGLAPFQGGLLGVGIFFTLSGYLITGVLVGGWRREHSWRLRTFWIRRARRLLPAVVMLLAACLMVVLITDRADLGKRELDALAALLYVANWHTIFAGDSYFTQVHGPGPFDHLWSLSVEEQYYLVWPLLVAVLVSVFRARMVAVAATTALLATGSFVVLAVLAHPGLDNTRAYEGTDARAGGLLVGACLALLWRTPDRDRPERAQRWRRDGAVLDALGMAGLAGTGWLVANTTQSSFSLYRWGLLLLSLCTVALLAAVSQPATLLGRVFRIPPLRWLGERSYGLYLWHLPVIVFTPANVLASDRSLRDALQVGLTVGLAALSWSFVEDPIRTRGLVGAFRGTRATAQPAAPRAGRRSPGWAIGASAFLPVALAALLLPHALPRTGRAQLAAAPPPPLTIPTVAPASTPGPAPDTSPARTSAPTPPPPTQPRRTACKSVILVGDSTSEGLYGPESALSPKQNLADRLMHVGVHNFVGAISGARSIIESYDGQASGEDVIEQHVRAGYRGCWIIALGNIDAATVAKYAPDTTSIADRISTVMRTIPKHSPVMWMTTRTILTAGDFRESVYPAWSRGLVQACGKYPNMRVYDWASAYKTAWIGPDGIHATTTGYRHKAYLMARAMVAGFPATGPPPATCVIASRGRPASPVR
jgi:peptidoglycan/LPS O-acetylase OafA/YrhL